MKYKSYIFLLLVPSFWLSCKVQHIKEKEFFLQDGKNKALLTRADICQSKGGVWREDNCMQESILFQNGSPKKKLCEDGKVYDSSAKNCVASVVSNPCQNEKIWDGNKCVLKTLELNFYRYCISPGGNSDIEKTLLILKKLSGIKSTDCSEIFKRLKTRKRFFLNGQKIVSIEPLHGLNDLEQLILRDNQIANIKSLSRLEKIKILDLSGNKIADISFLRGLSTLEQLFLSKNQISDFSPLESLKSLIVLTIEDQGGKTYDQKTCPSENVTKVMEKVCKSIRGI